MSKGNKIVINFESELVEFEKTKFNKSKDLDDARILLEEKVNTLRILQLIEIFVAEGYLTRLKNKYSEENKRLQQDKENQEAVVNLNDDLFTLQDKLYVQNIRESKNNTNSMNSWREEVETSSQSTAGSNNESIERSE